MRYITYQTPTNYQMYYNFSLIFVLYGTKNISQLQNQIEQYHALNIIYRETEITANFEPLKPF